MRLVKQRNNRDASRTYGRVALELVADRTERGFIGDVKLVAFPGRPERTLRPCLASLPFHRLIEARLVHTHVFGGRRVLDEVVRHAERVVQPEGDLARKRPLRGHQRLLDFRLQAGQAVAQHGIEPVFLRKDRPLDGGAVGFELRVRAVHLTRENGHEGMEKRLVEAEVFSVAHRAAHDFPQHISAELVRRNHAVADEKRRRADVVRDHAHRDVVAFVRAVRHAGELADPAEQRLKNVRVVVGFLALHHGREPFEAHACVDRRRRKRRERAVLAPVELHEHVVPDFDLRIAAGSAHVVDFRAAAAGACVAHLPEVVVGPHFQDPFCRHELLPDFVGVGVPGDSILALEDGHDEAILRHLPDVCEQRPGELDCVLLEVVAEGKITEHLEERVMAMRRPDVVEVVVLAADAHDLLRCRRARVRALFPSEERILELVHPGVGEKKRRVVGGDERGTGHHPVAVLLEVFEKGRA